MRLRFFLFNYTCKIKSWTRFDWPMGIWLIIVSYETTNQKPFLVQNLIYKIGIIKRIHREDEEKCPRRNSRLPKKHLFQEWKRPEVLRKTFRRYKISKAQNLETLVLLQPHLIVPLSLDILSSSVWLESKSRLFVIHCLTNVFQ